MEAKPSETARLPPRNDHRYTVRMNEFMSLKVSSREHADLATQLSTLSTQGWSVVNIVSTGEDLIAYLSRPGTAAASAPVATATPTPVGDQAGWAASTSTPAASSAAATTPSSATPAVPADWYKDPSGRFEHRYWDGSKWTDNVARAGVTYKDPPVP